MSGKNVSTVLSQNLDQRRYERIKKELPIHFNLYKHGAVLPSNNQYNAQTRNLSMGGISFNSIINDKFLVRELKEKKIKLNLSIFLVEKNIDIKTKGNIAWIYSLKALPIKTKYSLGVSFINMKKGDMDTLSSYIKDMIRIKHEWSKKSRKKIKQTLAQIAKVDEDSFTEDTNIREDLGIDSLMAMEILAAIETIFDIEIDEERVFDVVNVGDVMNLIEEYLEEKNTIPNIQNG